MYAVSIKLTSQVLKRYNLNDDAAFNLITQFLTGQDFTEERQGYYVGSASTNAVATMLAIQRLNKAYEWLQYAASDIQMLRIEEINSLMPLLISQKVKKLAYA